MYQFLYIALALGFATVFGVVVVPPLVESGDIVGAFAAGFVNPFASGYSVDVFFCWAVLAVWVVQEARLNGVKYGWLALALGVAPGVATGFAVYLLIRQKQLNQASSNAA
jgi:hypothetical protein